MTSHCSNAAVTTDIAIIGGGMVGATLALLLAAERRDWQVTLVEAFAFPTSEGDSHSELLYQPSFDARSTAITAGSAQILASALSALGVWQLLAQHATPIRRVHVSDRGHIGGTLITGEQHSVPALGYVIENAWMGTVLLDRLQRQPNVTCLAPAKVEKLVLCRQGAELHLQKNQQLHCAVAVVADGADSPLRKSLGIDAAVTDYGQTAIIANVAFDQSHRGVAYERFTDEGPLALLPLEHTKRGQRSALIWTQSQAKAAVTAALTEREFLQQLQRRFGYRLGYFNQVGQRYSYPLQLVEAREQVRSSVVIMGNAAHFLHPVAGQGFNLALRDCAALVETLSAAKQQQQPLGTLSVLQKYADRQALDQTLTTRFSDAITKLFSTATAPAVILRNLGFLGLDALTPAQNFLARQTMGIAGRAARLQKTL